jgi:hypothetical protein
VGARPPPKGHLRNGGTVNHEGLDQLNVFGRIDTVMTASENGDRAGLQGGAVCRRVDAACEDRRRRRIPQHRDPLPFDGRISLRQPKRCEIRRLQFAVA